MSFFRSFRFRLTALFIFIFGSTLIGFSFVLYREYRLSHQADFDATLYNYAVDLSQAIDIGSFGDVELRGQILRDKIFPFPLGKAFLQIRTLEGEIIARSITLGSAELPITDEELNLIRDGQTVYRLVEFKNPGDTPRDRATFRQIDYVIHRPPIPNLVLQIAVPTTVLDRQMRSLFAFFATWIPMVLLLSSVGGFYASGWALRPVRDIIKKARVISATDLNVRVPVPESDDELRELALTLNSLLSRLQMAFESQDHFVANASHQLKTPLAILKGELDILMTKERSREEVKEFLESARQELGHLSKIVADLLLIAKMNAGKSNFVMQKLPLDEVILQSISRLESLAAKKNVKLRFSFLNPEGSDYEVHGDPDLLQSMFYNLFENATKWSPSDGVVKIELGRSFGRPFVLVKDEGPGIPEKDRDFVFGRFERGEKNNSQTPGVGLGLAIAQQIAEIHGGKLQIENDSGPGATFRFEMTS